jgi:tripartite-type tricarboxylate transporter receptor subunit TctC
MVEYARKNPGTVRFGSPGVTSWGAFGSYSLEAITGVEFQKVPLRGHSDIVAAMLRGEVDVASATFAGFKPQVDAGKFRAIGVSSDKRSEFLPDVPTYKEQGIEAPTDENIRYVWVRKEVPEKEKIKLEAAFKAMCEDPLVKKRVFTLNQSIEFHGREEAWKIAQKETEFFRKLIDKFGLKAKK